MRYKSWFIIFLAIIICLSILSCDDSNPVFLKDQPVPLFVNNVSFNRTSWKISSEPYQLNSETGRSIIYWYNPIELVPVEDVFDIEVTSGYEAIRTLKVIFEPNESGQSWAGITTGYVTSLPYMPEFFEIIAKGNSGKVHFEFGLISEDIDNDGMADNEDKDFNGVISEDEDVGLDGLADLDEPGYDPITNPDPNGDNWYYEGFGKCPVPDCSAIDWSDPTSPNYYRYINGTEGNIDDMASYGMPDQEILRNTRGFVMMNSYYSFDIDLSDPDFVIDSLTHNGWKRFRLPINDSLSYEFVSDGTTAPSWQTIFSLRIWFESDDGQNFADSLEIAGMYFSPDTTTIDTTAWVDDGSIFIRDYNYANRRIFDLALPGELQHDD